MEGSMHRWWSHPTTGDQSVLSRTTFLLLMSSISLTAAYGCPASAQDKVWRIGYLRASQFTNADMFQREALIQGLAAAGYVEGKNLAIDWRFSDGRTERYPELVADLV